MHRTMQGDTFEEVAYREYGSTSHAEALMNANRDKIERQEFEAGVELKEAEIVRLQKELKAPWQS